ncbi:MAG TPA: orotidine-5'-phosphate decarboxylase [Longimicrobiaceae bacterium]|nr:orotidine-5'-phosphate decarboxylase [Longimicrobiaceae bacterium]
MKQPPTPIIALDVPRAEDALALVGRLGPAAGWVKVGLQLYTAEGPGVVRALRDRGLRVFLDLKLHDIPNTVARAVESAAGLGVDLLTVHAAGGRAMLRAAREAAGERGGGGVRLFAVTVLTSLSGAELGEAWGRTGVSAEEEAVRLARLADGTGMDGVVASVHEAARIRTQAGKGVGILTPGIRLAGDAAGDQARVATPAQAAGAGVDFVVVGRTVTAADDPAAAFRAVRDELAGGLAAGAVGP